MAIDKAMWFEWKNHLVTQQVYKTIFLLKHELEERLGRTAGQNQYTDAFTSGQVQAYASILDMEADDD